MAAVLALAVSLWLWLGIVPQLMLGSRRRPPRALVREWLAGPVGLAIALGHRDHHKPQT
ncbi:MAG: hypothetical protein QM733_11575 [Ilumatobacteraceae bacterium]